MIKMFVRGYITEGAILILTSFFSLTKGTEYIHMAFDATVSGLSGYLWDPKFIKDAHGRSIHLGYFYKF